MSNEQYQPPPDLQHLFQSEPPQQGMQIPMPPQQPMMPQPQQVPMTQQAPSMPMPQQMPPAAQPQPTTPGPNGTVDPRTPEQKAPKKRTRTTKAATTPQKTQEGVFAVVIACVESGRSPEEAKAFLEVAAEFR